MHAQCLLSSKCMSLYLSVGFVGVRGIHLGTRPALEMVTAKGQKTDARQKARFESQQVCTNTHREKD